MPSLISNFLIVLMKLCRASNVNCQEPVHSISYPYISFFQFCHIIIFYIFPIILNCNFSEDFLHKILSPAFVFLCVCVCVCVCVQREKERERESQGLILQLLFYFLVGIQNYTFATVKKMLFIMRSVINMLCTFC